MKSNHKASISSRTSVRSLIVACLPAAGVGWIADSPASGAAFGQNLQRGLTVCASSSASTNGPNTNAGGNPTNAESPPIITNGIRG